ncbi:protein MRG1-like [Apium graveolens]|uniref:protein MRG1-like n=1 Tax=Apium graveolens TaxID=4045 RepID=UPI003D7BF49A
MGRSNSGVSRYSLTNSLYLEGEKVLAFYGGKWYPAKVRKVEYEKQIEAWTYWVHYIGWNKRYDEWILDAQLLKKFSEECSQKHLGKRGRSAMEDPLIMEENKLSIEIPQALKTQLLNDREYVTNSSKVKRDNSRNLKGLCNYFNKALSTKLLYKTELQQYDEVRAKNIQPSTIYGAEHFLRLLVL